MSAACAILTVYAQKEALRASHEYPLLTRLGNAAAAYVEYIGMMFWPINLSAFYPYDKNPSPLWHTAAALILAAITSIVVWQWRRPYLLIGWFWYVGTLVPVIGIVQVGAQALADRYTYIPSIGFFLALVWGLSDLVMRVRIPAWIRAVAAAGAVLVSVCLTRIQVEYWRDSWTLWGRAADVNPENYLAQRSLAQLYWTTAGDAEKAIEHYRLAIKADPNDALSFAALGQILQTLGRVDEAIALWQEGLRYKPDEAEWHHNLGQNLLNIGKKEQAIEHFQKAVRLKPDLTGSHWLLYQALKNDQPEEAARHRERAYQLMPELRRQERE
jgi:tetratricopeptide (TPR) repeat protein